MSIHIGAEAGEIAETVLLPGDPLRARYISETFLEDVKCYSEVRGMYGFTGTYKGKKVSIQGTGMGLPSISIYAHELINQYGCKNLIRIGSAGGYQKDVKVGDVILSQGSSSESGINKRIFKGMDFAAIANFELLKKAYDNAESMGMNVTVGNTLSADTFYNEQKEEQDVWAKHGVLAVEMEATALYTLAARFGVKALAILTVSDHLITGEALSAEERQFGFKKMMELGLSLI